MGQYYTVSMEQDGEVLVFGNEVIVDKTTKHVGRKITEQAWLDNEFATGIAKKLMNNPSRLAWVGDYTSEEDMVGSDGTPFPITFQDVMDIYGQQKSNKPNVKYVEHVWFNPNFTYDNLYFVNLTKKEYVDMNAYIQRSIYDDGYCMNPIPLLTSTGGDKGGGDYHQGHIDQNKVGVWKCDLVKLTKRKPGKEYKVLNVTFNEDMEVPCNGLE